MFGLLAIALAGLLAGAPPEDQRDVSLRLAEVGEDIGPRSAIDELADGTVLDLAVSGADADSTGHVEQCDLTCTNRYPVRFDEDGRARVQYQLADAGECTATGSCTLRVTAGDLVASAFVVFGGPAAPAPDVRLSPAGELQPGETVTVIIRAMLPGSSVRVAWCDDGCDRPTVAEADEAGAAAVSIVVGDRCDRCGITVLAGSSRTVVAVDFAAAPVTRYDGRRVLVGLGVGAALLAAAWWLIVTTDWRPPSEAAVVDPAE